MPRLFFALTFDDNLIQAMQEPLSYLGTYQTILKPVESQNMHITVKFLGECGDDIAGPIIAAFQNFTIEENPIAFSARGLSAFPRIASPSVIWCGLDTGPEINTLHRRIELFSEPFGFPPEDRSFKPHLTLARIRKNSQAPRELVKYLEDNRATVYCTTRFKKLVLFKSLLTKTGPIYTELHSMTL
ncbi:MAG: RNA 2',3'-cyclic phosphodiesterase [Spirochaetae bacterium HGW-Spirochaetae-1]|jgi:2'-5' RNA ligase|nr:MAG: RNA 2',3'-cyclic phosphodiesterase [Spirochaetae bacterium HGW-Spirochaetae-1]